jgi:hypothetical protein
MLLKRLFRPGCNAGLVPCLPWLAALVLTLAACGDGDTSLSSEPVVPVTPATPSAAANSVIVAMPQQGEIITYVGQSKTITLAFRASEGMASGLTLSLPAIAGWRAAGEPLNCATIDTTDACRLQVTYAPTGQAASSTLPLSFAYTDSTGASRQGAHTLAYRALPANTIVTSQQPEGVLRGIVGRTATVTLDFNTSDGEAAASLGFTTDLTALPAGWKSDKAQFGCTDLGRTQPCRLTLAYSPLAPAAVSMLDLAYRYVDSSGVARSGAASVGYSAILPGSVVAAVDTTGPVLVKPGARREVTVRFQTSDGVGASALRLSADPANTAGWSIAPGWQGCAAVQGSDSCSLTLVFAPTLVRGPATLSLSYAYIDNIGELRRGSVEIDYASRVYEAYIADYADDGSGGVRLCTLAADGGLSNCAAAQIDLPAQGRSISHVVASGRQAYVASLAAGDRSAVFLCAIAADGALKACRETGSIRTGIRHLSLRGASMYLLTAEGKILRQDIDVASGDIRACPARRENCDTAAMGKPVSALGFAGKNGYVAMPGPESESKNVEARQCSIRADGDLDCNKPAFLSDYYFAAGALATLQDGDVSRVYIVGEPYYALLDGEHAVVSCAAPADGVAGCQTGAVARLDATASGTAASFRDMTFDGRHAYIVQEADIFLCDVGVSDGTLPNCRRLAGSGATRHYALSINRID